MYKIKSVNLYKSLVISLYKEAVELGETKSRKLWELQLNQYITAVKEGDREFFKSNSIYEFSSTVNVGIRSLIAGARYIWGYRGYVRPLIFNLDKLDDL